MCTVVSKIQYQSGSDCHSFEAGNYKHLAFCFINDLNINFLSKTVGDRVSVDPLLLVQCLVHEQ